MLTSPWQYALTLGPLAAYFWVLALWQAGRSPRVVRGIVDFVMLVVGVGGVLAFGPFGRLVARMVFTQPRPTDQVAVAAGLGLCACVLARGALRRLVVYQIDEGRLVAALDEVLIRVGGRFARTLNGFEDRASGRALRIEITRWLGCAVVEAVGRDPEGLIFEVRPLLAKRLKGEPGRRSSVALGLYVCSSLVSLTPILVLLLQPRGREVLRVLLQKIKGG